MDTWVKLFTTLCRYLSVEIVLADPGIGPYLVSRPGKVKDPTQGVNIVSAFSLETDKL